MCRELHGGNQAVKQLFDKAADVLGYDLAEVCFHGPEDRLNSTVVSQPALYVCCLAALEVLKQTRPDVVDRAGAAAGLSLGEYPAIVFAGGLSFEDGLNLVAIRGQAMQAASDAIPSGMVSVLGLDREQVENVCDEARTEGHVLQPANFLCPGNIAVSGHRGSCDAVESVAARHGAIKSIPLPVAGAFHTELMKPAVNKLAAALEKAKFRTARIPVYSNVDAHPHTKPDEFKRLLQEQVCAPVHWQTSMERMLSDGYNQFYEVGPGRVLCGLMKRIARKTPCEAVLD
jgi:[acyl-carrier-protein] S-malonyltransferase